MNSKTDKLMTELGYISMFFSNFDFLLNEINVSLINLDNNKIGNYISSKLNTHARIEMFKTLLDIIPFSQELVKKAKTNLSDFSDAKAKRNELIHGIWHMKTENDIGIDEFYLGKLNSDWDYTKKIDIVELKKLKENLIGLIQKQIKINIDLLTHYRELTDNEIKIKSKISRIFKESMAQEDLTD